MASIAREGDGWRVQWFDASGKRQSLRTGKMSETNADGIKRRIEGLLAARASGEPMPKSLAEWVANLSDRAHAKLSARGLLESREARRVWTLGELMERFFSVLNVKESTRLSYAQTRAMLEKDLGKSRAIASIKVIDAEEWVRSLRESGLAKATVAKRLKVTKQIFAKAVKWGMVPQSVFADFRAGSMHNAEKTVFVSRETIAKVLDEAPDAEWRCIIALSRYGGLRCPSETIRLRWRDVDWDSATLRVASTKTEGNEGGGVRRVPIFPELMPFLRECYEAAPAGAEFVVSRYRDTGGNLRTQMLRFMERAGVQAWPRTFHALRGSRATELAAQFPARDAASWLGHSVTIAQTHYVSCTDENFRAATTTPTGAKPWPSGANGGAQTGQKAAQRRGARQRGVVKTETQSVGACTVAHQSQSPCTSVHEGEVAPVRLVTSARNAGNTHDFASGGAGNGAIDRELAAVLAAWATLPKHVRDTIASLVRTVKGDASIDAAR